MSIKFDCEQCGHPIEVADRLEGKHGTCKHCGHHIVVPAHEAHAAVEAGEAGAGLRLRPVESDEPERVPAHLLAPAAPLVMKAAEADPQIKPAAISAPDEPEAGMPPRVRSRGGKGGGAGEGLYDVTDPYGTTKAHSSAGPPPGWLLLPSQFARLGARILRTLRDWFYVVSIVGLLIVLYGYLFSMPAMLHLGAVIVVVTNIGILVSGLAYLVSLPFKESLHHGLANLFFPPYAIYYWATRWHRMRRPVFKTLGSLLPIALVGLAYLVYEEAPAIEHAIEKRAPALEEKLERALKPVEKATGTGSTESAAPHVGSKAVKHRRPRAVEPE